MECVKWSVECGVQSVECRAGNATRLKCCTCHTKWRQRSPKCCACHENRNSSWENVAKVLRLPHKTTFDTLQNTSELMSESATPATRSEATPHVKPPKVTPFAELTIGTAIRPSRGRLWTVANGCGRLRKVADGWATSSEHPQPPDPQSETGTLATHSGRKPPNKSRKCSMSCETLKLLYSKIALPPFKTNPSWIFNDFLWQRPSLNTWCYLAAFSTWPKDSRET